MNMERGIITITENGAVAMPTAPVWMTQQEMSDAFNVFGCYIRKVIAAIYKNKELSEEETVRHVRQDGRISYDVFSLEMVVAVAFKLRSRECMAFRRFVVECLTTSRNSKPINLFFSLSPYNGLRVNNRKGERKNSRQQAGKANSPLSASSSWDGRHYVPTRLNASR